MVETSSGANEKSDERVERRRSRKPVEESGELVECSGKYCSSCTANFVADCIAVCCCPCAIVNLLMLAFVKVPWMMGRRCLRFVKKKGRLLGRKKRRKKEVVAVVEEKDGNLRKERVGEEISQVSSGSGSACAQSNGDENAEEEKYCARYEAEKVWLELYEIGQLGFGRVSFSEVSGKENEGKNC